MVEQRLQICFVLKGRDAAAFLAHKSNSFLSADSEVARQLVLQRLAQIQHEADAPARRKPAVRSRRRESDSGHIMLSEFESENVA